MSSVAMQSETVAGSQAGSIETTRPFFSVRDVHAYYGESYIVQGVSLDVRKGEILALLGRNGAGKSSTLRTIARVDNPQMRNGEIWLDDQPIHAMKTDASSRVSRSRKTLPSQRWRRAMAGTSSKSTRAFRAWPNAASRRG
jgi:branched-chain amino acid transport system ATP-binding protein